jgi:hypothetical protein
VQRRWYQFVVNHRATRLKARLLLEGGPQISVMSTPWYPDLSPRQAQSRWRAIRSRRLHHGEALRTVTGSEATDS